MGGGLFLYITTNGKYWRAPSVMKESGKPYLFGSYPAISLLQARELHLEARAMLARGINPSSHKRALKQANIQTTQNSFEAVALEWFTRNRDRGSWSESHIHRTISYLTRDVFPWVGKANINDVKPGDIIKIVQRVEDRGAGDAARRVKHTSCKSTNTL